MSGDMRELLMSARDRDERDLRRIEHRKLMKVATWDDYVNEFNIKRRMADQAFDERERTTKKGQADE